MKGNPGNIHLIQSLKGLWKKLILLCMSLFAFNMLFCILGTSATIKKEMLHDMGNVPELVQKMMGSGFVEAMLKYGIMTVGYIHPFMLVICILFIFLTVSHILTGEIGSGTIGFTLSKPISRIRLFINMAVIIYSGLGLLAFSAYASSYLGIVFFHGPDLSAKSFGPVAMNLFLLLIFITGYVVILAAVSDSSKKLYTYGGILVFVFYLLSLAAPLWKPLEYLSPINPFSYYTPLQILVGIRIGMLKSMVIAVTSVSMFALGAWIFRHRDIASG